MDADPDPDLEALGRLVAVAKGADPLAASPAMALAANMREARAMIKRDFNMDVPLLGAGADALDALRQQLDTIGLAYIEASNPGIDMAEVKRLRAAGSLSEGPQTDG